MRYITNKDLFTKYRKYEAEAIDLNVASLARPSKEVTQRVFASKGIDPELARQKAAGLANANPEHTLFGRNGTEAMRYVSAIEKPKRIVLYGVENFSTKRNFEYLGDFGNTDKKDHHSTFADKGFEEANSLFSVIRKRDNVSILEVQTEQELLMQSQAADVIVFPHISQTGNLYNIEQLITKIKTKSSARICVDGCQAIGNIGKIDVKELFSLGLDYYVAVAHKHIGAHPLGICYANPETVDINRLTDSLVEEQVIMTGMIAGEHTIKPNVSCELNNNRLKSLAYAIEELEGRGVLTNNDFSSKVSRIEPLMQKLRQRFKGYELQQESPAILGVYNLPEDIKEKLIKRGVFFSRFKNKTRFSLSEKNTSKEIDELEKQLK